MRTPAPEPEPEAEEETLEEDSNPATVETSAQTDLGMHDVVPMTQYWEETQQMIYEMQHNFVPLHVHEDRVDSLSRDLDRAHELSFRRTQNPIYFTMSGRCWHADRECLRRRSSTQIIEKNYCTQCCFALGNEEAMLQPNDGWLCWVPSQFSLFNFHTFTGVICMPYKWLCNMKHVDCSFFAAIIVAQCPYKGGQLALGLTAIGYPLRPVDKGCFLQWGFCTSCGIPWSLTPQDQQSYNIFIANPFHLFDQDYKTKVLAYQDLSRWKGRHIPS